MTLQLNLPPDLERRLEQEAGRRGLPADQFTLRLLDEHLPAADRRADAISLLQRWIDNGDENEHRATGEFLVRALDEDRLSDRKLFPPELKGVTW
jgi:hypothetical protein